MPKLLDDRRLLDFQRRLALLEATKDIRQSDVKPYRFGGEFEEAVSRGLDQPVMSTRQSQLAGYAPPMQNVTNRDLLNFAFNVSPGIGDAQAIVDAKREADQGNYGMAAFNAATALPLVGDIAAVTKAAAPTLLGLGGIVGHMMRRGGDVPVTPFSRQAGVIGGVNAKTANLDLLKKAQDMAEQGVKREDIWSQTGWFKGVDGKWRFEIDDSTAVFKQGHKGAEIGPFFDDAYQGRTRLPFHDVMEHPGATAAYSEKLSNMGAGKQMPGFIAAPFKDSSGRYLQSDDLIELNRRLNKTDARSTALHELQHAIQQREGFARGGSPEMFSYSIRRQKSAVEEQIQSLNLEMSNNVRTRDRLAAERYANPDADGMIQNLKARYDELMAKKLELVPQVNFDVSEKAFDQYHALAGEAEARAVQARRNLTPSERAARPFWLDYDVPEKDFIIK